MADSITSSDSLAELRNKISLTTNPDTLNFKDLKYIPIDYESIVQLLIDRLKARLPDRWTDFLESNFGMEILEAVAYEASMLAFLVNRYVNELYLPTAKTVDGVYNLVKLIGYKPKGPTASTALLRFYIDQPHDALIKIPAYCPVGSGFYTTAECRIEPGQLSTTTYATAGKIVIDKFLTTGSIRDRYNLREAPVSYIEAVFVNKELFEERDFIDSLNDRKVYAVEYTNDFHASIYFGDGNYGENPKEGLPLVVYYNVNTGSDSNTNAFEITTIDEVITDVNGNVVDVKVINPSAASGGKAAETPEEVKRNAPAYFRTQYRAVLRQDFKDIINALGYNKVTVIDNNIDSNIGIFGVKIAALNNNGEILSEAEKQDIYDEIDRRKIIATQFEIVKPSIIPVNLSVNLVVNPSYMPDIVVSKVRKLLTEYLSLNNRVFGDVVSAVDIYSLINTVDGVSYAEHLKLEENRTATVLETAEAGSNTLKIQDSSNSFTEDSYISIIDNANEVCTVGRITSINGETYTLSAALKNEIPKGSYVFPVLSLKYDAALESKEIYIESQGPVGEIANSVITFIDDASKTEHVVMYRAFAGSGKTGEKYRLTAQLGRNYQKGSQFYIKKKNPLPVVDGSHALGSTTITFKTKPRFIPGAILVPRKNVTYDIETRTMVRNSDTYDTLPTDVAITDVRRVYTTPISPFKEGIDYRVNNTKTIVWLNQNAIPVNKQYYVDIVKVSSISGTSDIRYYVSSVQGYTATVSPSLGLALEDGDVLDVETDSLNITELEIADAGVVNITATQSQN